MNQVRKAYILEAAALLEPKGPRPCDCDTCDCGNTGDLREVEAWDTQKALYDQLVNLAEAEPTVKVSFDLWRNGNWVGMTEGKTVQEARQMVLDSGMHNAELIIMTPFYDFGQSKETYELMIGQRAR